MDISAYIDDLVGCWSVLSDVRKERLDQDAQWGEQNHPDGTGSLLFQHERDDVKQMCEDAAAVGKVTWTHILREEVYEALAESDPAKLRSELIQVSAVAAAWAEAIDRRTEGGEK